MDLIIAEQATGNVLTVPAFILGDFAHKVAFERGQTELTMMNGGQISQTRWKKLILTLTANCLMPPGLHLLDPAALYVITWPAALAIASGIPSPIIPANSQVDYYAILGGRLVPNPSHAAVTGASSYRAHYWPYFTARVKITENHDVSGLAYSWTLTARES